MKKNTEPMRCGCFYHIYNRGINKEDLFKEEKNYRYFLEKYAKYIPPVAETFAYCLLKNHFHLMVKTLGAAQIVAHFYEKEKISAEALSTMPHEETKKHEGVITAPISEEKEKIASKLISRQFATLFNSYAQAINKSYDRTGGLFEEPFRRAAIRNEAHCCSLMAYIHTNAQKHNFVKDFRLYPHSSYQSYLSQTPTRLKRSEALSWFGGKEEFEQFHLEKKEELEFTAKYLEFD